MAAYGFRAFGFSVDASLLDFLAFDRDLALNAPEMVVDVVADSVDFEVDTFLSFTEAFYGFLAVVDVLIGFSLLPCQMVFLQF